MDVPGRWAGGSAPGTRTASTWRPAGEPTSGGCSGCQRKCLAEKVSACSVQPASPPGLYHTARSLRRQPAADPCDLGTLAAGFAHEINNRSGRLPAVDALDDACQTLLSSLSRLARDEISPGSSPRSIRCAARSSRTRGPGPADPSGPRGALSIWLARRGVAASGPSPPLAPPRVDLGLVRAGGCGAGRSALEPGLDWVASTFSIAALLSEMRNSTQRISELVAAIKSYSQMDRARCSRSM